MMWAQIVTALLLSAARASAQSAGSIHTVFTTECTPYFTWQSLGAPVTHLTG